MSYDLMVFDPASAPAGQTDFMQWYLEQIDWADGQSYDDPAVSTLNLQAWFFDMIQDFPALNGPFSQDVILDEDAATD